VVAARFEEKTGDFIGRGLNRAGKHTHILLDRECTGEILGDPRLGADAKT